MSADPGPSHPSPALHFARSIRVRLALWHVAVLATVLAGFTAATYAYISAAGLQRVDESLVEQAFVFMDTWNAERTEEQGSIRGAAADAVQELRYRDRRFLVLDADGRLVAISDSAPLAPGLTVTALLARDGVVHHALPTPRDGQATTLRTLGADENAVRLLVRRVTVRGEPYVLVLLHSLRVDDEAREGFLHSAMLAVPLALLLAALGGYVLARASLAPVVDMADRAARISATTVHDRLPIAHPDDELGHLGRTLNDMLERLSESIEQQRRFMADASHELRTPVATLRLAADVALADPNRPSEDYQEALRLTRSQGRRMARIVEDLFLLARADSGDLPMQLSPCDLSEISAECARAIRPLAAARAIHVSTSGQTDGPLLLGDEMLLQRLLTNLLDNAIKHAPDNGTVSLMVDSPDGVCRVRVRDSGPGVPDEHRAHVFTRFFRGDPHRGRAPDDIGGAGLGLAIARWIAEAHGGTLSLDPAGPGEGASFTLAIPRRDI